MLGGALDRMRAGDRGAVSAEFAVLLPAVLVVLALVIGGILLATQRLTLTAAAAELARLEARGDAAQAAARIERLPSGTSVSRSRDDQMLCVTLDAAPGNGPLAVVRIGSRGCAAVLEEEIVSRHGHRAD